MPVPADSYCGIQCARCPVFLANREGWVDALAKERGVPADTLICHGCKSDRCTSWCTDCTLKRCARDKGVSHCWAECNGYPCPDLLAHTNVPVLGGRR